MAYRVLADLTVAVHFLFILFVVFGGFLALRWPRLAWAHVPAFLWGGAISLFGWVCPLTYLENHLRAKGAEAGHSSSFIEAYLVPLIYPEQLFGSFPDYGFTAIGVFVLLLNAVVYWRFSQRVYRSKSS